MTVYLDTSSLVKLYVEENGSDSVREIVSDADVVCTSMVTYPETRAAFARLRRAGFLTTTQFASAKREFERQWPAYLTVDLTLDLAREAGDLAERYALRGFNAVHLASYVGVARQATAAETRFSSFDERLNKAAEDVARRLRRRR